MPTVVNRGFPVVATRSWNDLPSDLSSGVTSAESLSTFHRVSVCLAGVRADCIHLRLVAGVYVTPYIKTPCIALR